MVSNRRVTLRARLAVAVVAVLVSGVGAAIWSRTVGSDDVAAEDRIVLSDSASVPIDPNLVNPSQVGEPLPSVKLETETGERISLAPSSGVPMVVNVWTTTCGPCSRELKYFGDVAARMNGAVRFVGVNPQDDFKPMIDFAETRGADYELYRDEDLDFMNELKLVQFPLTLFVDADGTIVAQTGELSLAELEAHVAALVR